MSVTVGIPLRYLGSAEAVDIPSGDLLNEIQAISCNCNLEEISLLGLCMIMANKVLSTLDRVL